MKILQIFRNNKYSLIITTISSLNTISITATEMFQMFIEELSSEVWTCVGSERALYQIFVAHSRQRTIWQPSMSIYRWLINVRHSAEQWCSRLSTFGAFDWIAVAMHWSAKKCLPWLPFRWFRWFGASLHRCRRSSAKAMLSSASERSETEYELNS